MSKYLNIIDKYSISVLYRSMYSTKYLYNICVYISPKKKHMNGQEPQEKLLKVISHGAKANSK